MACSTCPDTARIPAFPAGLRALFFSTSVSLATADVEALRRPKSRDGRVRLVAGLGVELTAPLQVADAGNRGGGIPACLVDCCCCCCCCCGCCCCCCCCCGLASSAFGPGFRTWAVCAGCDAAFDDARLQPLKLSLRRREEPDDGVSGSVEVEVCAESEVSVFCNGRGPATMLCISTSLREDLYSPLGRDCKRANSPLPLGNELDEKGVVACRVGFRVGIGRLPMFGCASREESV